MNNEYKEERKFGIEIVKITSIPKKGSKSTSPHEA